MNTHRVGQNSLEPYRSSESSQKQSKSANMDQTGYAIEKVTWMLSGIIDLKISNPFSTFWGHFGHFWSFWRSQNQSESAKMDCCQFQSTKKYDVLYGTYMKYWTLPLTNFELHSLCWQSFQKFRLSSKYCCQLRATATSFLKIYGT